MGGGTHYRPPKLLPAERADIPRLIDVFLNAEKGNLLHMVADTGETRKVWNELFNLAIDHPEIILMKAIDVETNEIGAFGWWQLIAYGAEESKVFPRYFGASGMMMMAHEPSIAMSPLGKYINDIFTNFLKSWCFPTKSIYTAFLMTEPRFQRRGMGTALMNYGHNRADQDRVPMFLIATPVGHPLYLSLGWKEVSTGLSVDLRKWVPYADKGDQGWGNYRFYYMMRLPPGKLTRLAQNIGTAVQSSSHSWL